MSDHVTIKQLVEEINQDLPDTHGIDYRYNHTTGMHTLKVRSGSEASVKTTVDERAMNFVAFYNTGVSAGVLLEKNRRDQNAVKKVDAAAPEEPSLLSRLFRRNV